MNIPLTNGDPPWRSEAGFSLVEVSIALGIAAISLLSVLGLLPIGTSTNRNAIEQTRAASIARAIVSDLRSTPSSSSSSPLYKLTPAVASGSTTLYFNEDCTSPAAAITGSSRYRATVVFSSVSNGVVGTQVLLSWPAAAVPSQAAGNYEVVTMLRTN